MDNSSQEKNIIFSGGIMASAINVIFTGLMAVVVYLGCRAGFKGVRNANHSKEAADEERTDRRMAAEYTGII